VGGIVSETKGPFAFEGPALPFKIALRNLRVYREDLVPSLSSGQRRELLVEVLRLGLDLQAAELDLIAGNWPPTKGQL